MRLARKSSSHAAALRLRRRESFVGAFRRRLWDMCLTVVKLAGAFVGSQAAFVVAEDHVHHPAQAVLDHQWPRTMGPIALAAKTSEVM